jgi:hypothetical protein
MNKKKLANILSKVLPYIFIAIPIIIGSIVLFRFVSPFGLTVSYDFNIANNAELFGRIRDVNRDAYAEVRDNSLTVKDRFAVTKERVEFSIVPVGQDFKDIKIRMKLGSTPTQTTLLQVLDYEFNRQESFLLRSNVVKDLGAPKFSYEDFDVWSFIPSIQTKEDLDNKINELSATSGALSVCTLDNDFFHDPMFETVTMRNDTQFYAPVFRGSHVFSVYVGKDKKMFFGFTKRDLNWYSGTDEMVIIVRRQGKVIRQEQINDDGIYDGTQGRISAIDQPYVLELNNIEPGVYEIAVETTEDVLITKVNSKNPKVVVNRDMFLANNGIYGIFPKDVSLYTYTPRIFLSFYHDTSQNTMVVNGQNFIPARLQSFESLELQLNTLNRIDIPSADLRIASKDYYAFSRESYFKPTVFDNVNCVSFPKDVATKQDVLVVKNMAEDKGNGYYELTIPYKKGYVGAEGRIYFTFYNPGLGVDESKVEIDYFQIELTR